MRPAGRSGARVSAGGGSRDKMITALKQLYERHHAGDLRALKKAYEQHAKDCTQAAEITVDAGRREV
jgi:hypothetical protein